MDITIKQAMFNYYEEDSQTIVHVNKGAKNVLPWQDTM